MTIITKEKLVHWLAQIDKDGACDATDVQVEKMMRSLLAELESHVLCVKLPAPVNVKMGGDAKTKAMFSGMNMMLDDCKKAILAAGGTIEWGSS